MNKCSLNVNNGLIVQDFTNVFLINEWSTALGVGNALGKILQEKYEDVTEDALREKLTNWTNLILGIPGIDERWLIKLNKVKEDIDTIVNTSINYGRLQDVLNTDSEMEIVAPFRVTELVEFSTLNDLYGSAQQARSEMQKFLRYNILSSALVNFLEGTIVTNESDLNLSITLFQLRLVDIIAQYAKTKGIDANIILFKNGIYQKNSFTLVLTLAQDLFKDFNSIKLHNLYMERSLPDFGLALLAYNAWVILNNFDMLVKNLLGKSISIATDGFVDATANKYKLVKDSNLVKTWRTSEDVNAVNELGSITKLLIETTPMYMYDVKRNISLLEDQRLMEQTIELKDVMYAFALAQQHPLLREKALTIRYNPMIYVPEFIITALDSNIKFENNNQQIKNILYSVYKHFFQLLKKNSDLEYSLVQIMNTQSKKTPYVITDNLLSYITGMIDKTNPNNHIEYAVDSVSEQITPRFSSLNSLNTYKIMVLKTIDNINDVLDLESRNNLLENFKISLEDARVSDKTKWKIDFKSGNREFRILFNNNFSNLEITNLQVKIDNKYVNYSEVTTDKASLNQLVKKALLDLLDSTLFLSLRNRTEIVDLLQELLPKAQNEIDTLLLISALSCRVLLKLHLDTKYPKQAYNRSEIDSFYGLSDTYNKKWLNKKTGKIRSVMNDKNSSYLIEKIAQAQMIINGDVAKSTIKNLQGNAVAAEGLTNLANTVKLIWMDSQNDDNSAVAQCIFAQNPDLLKGIVLKSSAQSSDRLTVKPDKKFNAAESGYSAIMLDFLCGYAKTANKLGEYKLDSPRSIMFQPTVYSDKSTNILLSIDGSIEFEIDGKRKKFIDLTTLELLKLHFATMSNMFNTLKYNIINNYKIFYDELKIRLGDKANELASEILERGRKYGYTPSLDNFDDFNYWRDVIFPAINKFAKSKNAENTIFATKKPVLLFKEIVSKTSENIEFIQNVGKSDIEINPVLNYYFKMYNGENDSLFLLQVKKNQTRFLKNCLENFKIYWANDNGKIDERLFGAISRLGITQAAFESLWVDPDTKEMIFGYVDNTPIYKENLSSIIPGLSNVTLNPILEIFYSFDLIISTQFITSTVGGCYGHKNNFKTLSAKFLPDLLINTVKSYNDGRLASTSANNEITVLEEDALDVEHFFDYIQGDVESITSAQKKIVFEQLALEGYTLPELRRLIGNDKRAIQAFLYWHELSHVVHNDRANYWTNAERKSPALRNFLDPNKIAIEKRATREAWDKLRLAKADYDLQVMEEEEAGKLLTLFKRMVIYPATMHNYQQELLNGCATTIRVAAIEDVQADVYNFTGDSNSKNGNLYNTFDSIDALDGSGFCVPWVSESESLSLTEASAGVDKKTIGHNMNQLYLMGSEFKWALFALTNERIRNSHSGIDLRKIMKKMTDHLWDTAGLPFDITKNAFGESISLLGFGKDIYFKADNLLGYEGLKQGAHYKIKEITNAGELQYTITLCLVNEFGDQIEDDLTVTTQIDSNYKLWQAFGAECSEEIFVDRLGNKSLVFSDTSSQIVTFFANNTGILRTRENPIHEELIFTDSDLNKIELDTEENIRKLDRPYTQREIYQPLKYSDISYIVNASAIKNGQTNLNSVNAWTDDSELTSFSISTKHFGVQMDADHHADDSELTEMSQVISALEANGYTHDIAKQAYTDLGEIVYLLIKKYMDAVAKYYNINDSSELYEVVGKAFLDSFKNSSTDRADLSDALIRNLTKRLGEKLNLAASQVYIPFSDNAILSKLIATITSQINRSAIKRKYAGTGAVMIPAYDLIRIYLHNGKDYTFSGLVNEFLTTVNSNSLLEEDTVNGPELTNGLLRLGKSYRRYKLVIDEETGEPTLLEIDRFTITDLDTYYKLRENLDGSVFKEDFTLGRNLQPARTLFLIIDEDGEITDEIYDIYDTDAVKNKLSFTKWYSDYKKINDKQAYVSSNIDKLREIIESTQHNRKKLNDLLNKILNYDKGLDLYIKQFGLYLQDEIIKTFESLHGPEHYVYMNGVKVNVDESTIIQQEAELVVSKLYATKFGLKIGDSLDKIDELFFIDQLTLYATPNNNIYDIALKRANGIHTYIVTKENANKYLLKQDNVVEQNPNVRRDPYTGKLIRRDSEGNDLMPFDDCRLFKAGNIEYIVTDNIALFLDSEEYDSIQVNINHDGERLLELLKNSGDNELLDIYKSAEDILDAVNKVAEQQKAIIKKSAKRKYVSFLKSLEFTAARIPSQSMQSFMPMKVVAFTDSEENKAYVSHFQTFLLGSDYDIDKVYLLGNEFDDSGRYVGWSPFFDLTDISLLKISENIPMPTGKTITIVSNRNIEEPFDDSLSENIKDLIQRKYALDLITDVDGLDYKLLKSEYLRKVIDLLNAINSSEFDTFYCPAFLFTDFSKGDPNIRTVEDTAKLILSFLNLINRHLLYISNATEKKQLKMIKNSVSSKIRRIINDPKNMVQAYSPIEMNAPKEAASKSVLGNEEREYTLMNPAVKWIMHELNMVGKDAIGITAVGEKVLFALLFYYNELARSGEINKQVRGFFNKTFDLIKADDGDKISIIKNIIANINFDNNETIWHDLIKKEVDWIELNLANGIITLEKADLMSELLFMQLSVMEDSSLVNSALLSAATDNAKELILSKINATPDMLKIYTYCIVLGIDFNYIAELMTSNTVNAITKLSRSNIFMLSEQGKNINSALKAISNGIKPEAFGLEFKLVGLNGEGEVGALEFNDILLEFTGYKDKEGRIHKSFWKRHFDVRNGELYPFVESAIRDLDRIEEKFKRTYTQNQTTSYIRMCRFLRSMRELLNDIAPINLDELNLFKDMLEGGEELRILGAILGINQGIATNMVDKISYLNNFEKLFESRLPKQLSWSAIIKEKPYLENLEDAQEIFETTILKAKQLGIIISENGKIQSGFNTLQFLQNEEYRQTVIQLYDYIKHTINVFDVISTVPHFKAMTTAAAVDFMLFDVNSAKFTMAYNIAKKIEPQMPKLNKKQNEQFLHAIANFLSDVITTKYFKDRGIRIDIMGGFYRENGVFTPKDNDFETIDMGTAAGLASFKRWFETIVIPRLKRGLTSDDNNTVKASLILNRFIRDLLLTTSERTLTRDLKYVWTLPLNMSNISSVTDVNNFVGYLGAFEELNSYTYNNIPLTKLFAWYNLIVYKNLYGLDSLTKIFENYMMLPNNAMLDYFDYVGKLDYDKLLDSRDFSEEDLLLACAIEISYSQSLTNRYFGKYVKLRDPDTGTLRLYEWDDTKYIQGEDEDWLNDEDDWNDTGYDDDEGEQTSSYFKPPKKYKLIKSIDVKIKELMNYFPYIDVNHAIDRSKNLTPKAILQQLYRLGKILIYNDCG